MFAHYKEYICCPICRKPFALEVFKQEDDWLIDGLFSCEDKTHFFPLIGGVPRLLGSEFLCRVVDPQRLGKYTEQYSSSLPVVMKEQLNKHSQRFTQAARETESANFYRFQWEKYDTVFDQQNQHEFQRLTDGRLDFKKFASKSVIDVGAGMGRYVFPFLGAGASEVVCLDLGEAITLCAEKFRHDRRVLCIQTSIYHLPLKRQFDFVVSIGVLHHLPDPPKGFLQIISLVKRNGQFFAWVYGDSSIKPLLLFLRKITGFIPLPMLWWVSAFLALCRYLISSLGIILRKAGLDSLASRLPFNMYEGYNFHYLCVNTLDHLSTPIINFFTRPELEEWAREANLSQWEIIERFPGKSGSSWIVQGRK